MSGGPGFLGGLQGREIFSSFLPGELCTFAPFLVFRFPMAVANPKIMIMWSDGLQIHFVYVIIIIIIITIFSLFIFLDFIMCLFFGGGALQVLGLLKQRSSEHV